MLQALLSSGSASAKNGCCRAICGGYSLRVNSKRNQLCRSALPYGRASLRGPMIFCGLRQSESYATGAFGMPAGAKFPSSEAAASITKLATFSGCESMAKWLVGRVKVFAPILFAVSFS